MSITYSIGNNAISRYITTFGVELKVHTVLALNILAVYTTARVSVSFFLILVQVWQLNNKVLRNITWYIQSN